MVGSSSRDCCDRSSMLRDSLQVLMKIRPQLQAWFGSNPTGVIDLQKEEPPQSRGFGRDSGAVPSASQAPARIDHQPGGSPRSGFV
jgi:hypothetical protein